MKRDLFIVVADQDTENAVSALLEFRQRDLGIHLDFRRERDLLRFAGRDSGCYREAHEILRPKSVTHAHAIVVFDRHGSGARSDEPARIEQAVEERLERNGWQRECCAAVVPSPELESWVWAACPAAARIMGWPEGMSQLREFLEGQGHWNPGAGKPADPKNAMAIGMKQRRVPRSPRQFSEMAQEISFRDCRDRAFRKFQQVLQAWFPAT